MSTIREPRSTRARGGRPSARVLVITAIILGASLGSAAILADFEAAVWTDQAGYPAGSPITITGESFLPFEAVVLEIVHADGTAEPGMGHETRLAAADYLGAFSASWSIDPEDSAGDDFLLRAVGEVSGLSAQAAFTRTGWVGTDKFDYQPGEVARIAGFGFRPGEVVTLQVTHASGLVDGVGHLPFAATSDAYGEIVADWFVDPDDSAGSRFRLVARGETSGRTASVAFMDAGSISLPTLGAAYMEDFNTLASTGTSSTVPPGWEFVESGTNANTIYTAGTGSSNAGDTYSFGATVTSERALGGLRSGTLVPLFGAFFTNNTGTTITSLAVSYTGEQWRLGQNTTGRASDRIDFQLSTNATSLATGTWSDYDALDFSSPVVSGTVGALNGNVLPNRTPLSFTITGLSIPSGGTFWVRWVDADLIPGSDDGLAVDDFSLAPYAADEAPAVTGTSPADGATAVPVDANLVVTFSEPVNVSGTWFTISCLVSGAHTATVSGGPSVFTLNPDADFAGSDACTVSIMAAQVSDQDGNDPPDAMSASYVWSFATPAPDAAPVVTSTTPADGALYVALNANLTVTFSEPVNVSGAWFTLSCSATGTHAAVVTGGPVTFTLNPAADFGVGETCTLTILAPQASDQDLNDPPDYMESNYTAAFTTVSPCADPYTPIYGIQGSGLTAAITGPVTTKGIVVGDFEGASPALRGFFIQDSTGDANAATSDGLFVFNGNNNSVGLGDVVAVAGTVSEFQAQTQITATSITKCGTGSVEPTNVILPVASAAFLEQYEGMLVRLPQTLYVTDHSSLARFGQVTLSASARLRQPTNDFPPGAPALALQVQNELNRLIIDDTLQNQNPDPILFGRGGSPLSASNTLRGGDTATGIIGVMTYTWGGNSASPNAYRVRPVNALGGGVPSFQPANARPPSPPVVGGTLRVASMNLLNYFNTFDVCANGVGGTVTDCRGAGSAAEFDRQKPKTVAGILGTAADVVGVMELENDGYGPTGAIQDLVNTLNAASAPGTWTFIDTDAATGEVNALGTDAIKVGLLYKPARVTPVGQTAVLNSVAFVNGGDSGPRNRPSLAQAFERNGTGGRVILVVNHLKSKGSACDTPDAGDGQGNCALVRTNAVNELTAWLGTDPTGTNEPDRLLLGDFNSYAKEDPIAAAKAAGFADLIDAHAGADPYSYMFDGQWGYLDQALASPGLVLQVAGATHWHVNADEPSALDFNMDFKSAGQLVSLYAPDQYRMADHDPVLVGLTLTNNPPVASAGGPYSGNEGTAIALTATGSDPDGTPVTFAWDLDGDGTFETAGQSASFLAVDGPAEFTVSVEVKDATGMSTVASATVLVDNLVPGVTAAPTSQNVQYSDPIAAVLITGTDVAADIPLSATTSYQVNGGPFTSGLPAWLTLTAHACHTTGCTWSLTGSALAAPDTYVVRVTVADDGGSSSADFTIVVTKEDARATYTGALFASTGSATGTTASVTLAATIRDISVTPDAAGDTSGGDIRNATVTFVDRDAGGAELCSAPVGLVNLADVGIGTAMCSALVSLGSADSLSLRVGIIVNRYYTRNSTADDALVTVSRAIGTNFITGGGYLLAANSAGLKAASPGSRINFGFNVKFNKNRTNLQGRINAIVRNGGRTYQVKSNVMTSLVVNPSPCPNATLASPCSAVFNGKASITDVTNPVSPLPVDGNATLQVVMTDFGEPGRDDRVGITVWNKAGGLWFASRWDGVRAIEQMLAGGNVVVR